MKKEYLIENRYPYSTKINVLPEKLAEIKEAHLQLTKLNIQKMRKQKSRLKSLEYFDNALLDKSKRYQELKEYKAKGGKVIGVFCIHVPEELIYAAGAIPLRLSCGLYDTIAPAEELLPKNTCPLVKSSAGFNLLKINPLYELCDALIIPTSCDGKKKLAEMLSQEIPVYPFNLPNNKDNSKEYWELQIRLLKEQIEKWTSQEISKKSLKTSIQLLHKRVSVSRELLKTRSSNSPALSGRDIYTIMQTAFFDDIKRWIAQAELLLKEIKSQKANSAQDKSARILLTGSPLVWPNMKLLHSIEDSGNIIVADDSCSTGQYFYNPVELDDYSMSSMLQALGDRSLLPAICPIFVSSDDRIDRLLELIEQYKVQGVVYHVLRLCQVYDFEYIKISRALEKKGIPIIKIETEYSEEDIGQIRTRIEAFTEMMEARK